MIEANRVSKVVFEKLNGRWVAMIFVLNTDIPERPLELCVAWHPVGSRVVVDKIVFTQLNPRGIPWQVKTPGAAEE